MFRRIILLAIATLAAAATMAAAGVGGLRFHNEATDTTRINQLLIQCSQQDLTTPGQRVGWLARQLVGTPYVAHTLECYPDDEQLTINIDELDCTTLVDNVLAMAYTVGERRLSWRDFAYNLERMRYRGGALKGYPSRLHYISDWIVDNSHRDNLKEVTNRFPKVAYIDKTIDFMTAHRDRYPALADSANYEGVKNAEIGYRRHRYPYLKSRDVADKSSVSVFREGDVVAFTTKMPDLDVTHLGIIVIEDGQPHVLHASSSQGRVVLETRSMAEFFKRNPQFTGLRLIRLNEY